jgi:NADP-dependent 3-hydroxy acid dehydrogenase YdfG
MGRTILICGYGPGISDAVARKFGREGFSVALVARSGERLDAAVTELEASGIRAVAFPADLGDRAAVKVVVAQVREKLGPITVVHWNAYGPVAGDLVDVDVDELRTALDVGVTGLVAAVQSALPDLKAAQDGALLVTSSDLAFHDPWVDTKTVEWKAMGLGVAKAAQHKLAGLLSVRLESAGVYVGEVFVIGVVRGSAFDRGNGNIDGPTVAQKFWDLYVDRRDPSATIRPEHEPLVTRG